MTRNKAHIKTQSKRMRTYDAIAQDANDMARDKTHKKHKA